MEKMYNCTSVILVNTIPGNCIFDNSSESRDSLEKLFHSFIHIVEGILGIYQGAIKIKIMFNLNDETLSH